MKTFRSHELESIFLRSRKVVLRQGWERRGGGRGTERVEGEGEKKEWEGRIKQEKGGGRGKEGRREDRRGEECGGGQRETDLCNL